MARTLFQGGSIFDGSGGDPAPGDLVVEDGRVVDIGSGLDGDQAVDVGGCTILPGLFDCHVHVGISHVDLWRLAQQPTSYRILDAARNMARTLDAGITSVRDAGGADLGIRLARDDGLIRGPRIQLSLRMISQTGGHGDGWLPSGIEEDIFSRMPGPPRDAGRRARRDASRRADARPAGGRRHQGRHVGWRPLAARRADATRTFVPRSCRSWSKRRPRPASS